MAEINKEFCMSSYLTFRYVVKREIGWNERFIPDYPNEEQQGQIKVSSPNEIENSLKNIIEEETKDKKVGILLSGGIDSAIVASLCPKNVTAITIKFIAKNSIDESIMAKKYTQFLNIKHHVVEVTWQDYLDNMNTIMTKKKAPLHPAEIGLYMASKFAKSIDLDTLIVGNGADSTFGGMDKLLSKDWTFNEFVTRYSFLNAADVLKNPISMIPFYEKYRVDDSINVLKFLKTLHGLGIIQMFENAIHAGGCSISAPFEHLALDGKLDIERIRKGDTKYLLREIFKKNYPGLELPDKIPFARPMDDWMKNWEGPSRNEFKSDIELGKFTGEQKWLLYSLNAFLDLIEA